MIIIFDLIMWILNLIVKILDLPFRLLGLRVERREESTLSIVLQEKEIESLIKDFSVLIVPFSSNHSIIELSYLDLKVPPRERKRIDMI